MSKVAVVFWSGTGNTEAMANQVVEGAKRKGAEVDLFTAAEFEKSLVATYDAIAFGCPSMGVEQRRRVDAAHGHGSAQHAEGLQQRGARTLPRGGHRRAEARRSAAADHHVEGAHARNSDFRFHVPILSSISPARGPTFSSNSIAPFPTVRQSKVKGGAGMRRPMRAAYAPKLMSFTVSR